MGQPVGNWRDSNEGTGYGTIPFDVNSALVPASLRATEQLIQAGIVNKQNVGVIIGGRQDNVTVGEVAGAWERDASVLFEVTMDRATAEARLNNFVNAANLSQALLSASGSNSTNGNVTFYALSLMPDGRPVEVFV
jgi:hypothetical protein